MCATEGLHGLEEFAPLPAGTEKHDKQLGQQSSLDLRPFSKPPGSMEISRRLRVTYEASLCHPFISLHLPLRGIYRTLAMCVRAWRHH